MFSIIKHLTESNIFIYLKELRLYYSNLRLKVVL